MADLTALRQRVDAMLGSVDILAAFAGGDGMPVATPAERAAHWRQVVESDSSWITGVTLDIAGGKIMV